MIFLSILHQNSDVLKEILNCWTLKVPAELVLGRRAVRALLHEMLTREVKLPIDSYRLTADRSGRPVLESDQDIQLPAVSLTHSQGWIACAAQMDPVTGHQHETSRPDADPAIGLDLEFAKAGRDHLALAEAAFGPRENAAVQRGGSAAFYQIWTLREAWSKAAGLGFAGVTDRHDHVPERLLEECSSMTVTETAASWWSIRPLPHLHLALVSSRSSSVPQVAETENRSTPALWRCHVSPELDLSGFSFVNFDHRLSGQEKSGSGDAAT